MRDSGGAVGTRWWRHSRALCRPAVECIVSGLFTAYNNQLIVLGAAVRSCLFCSYVAVYCINFIHFLCFNSPRTPSCCQLGLIWHPRSRGGDSRYICSLGWQIHNGTWVGRVSRVSRVSRVRVTAYCYHYYFVYVFHLIKFVCLFFSFFLLLPDFLVNKDIH